MKRFNILRRLAALSLLAIVLLSAASCAKKISFQNSATVPAARGFVKVSKDKNNNYVIKIQISNLAEVDRLVPPKQTYVIWMLTDHDQTRNIGRLNSASKKMSKKLKAEFETVSSVKPIRIFITAENDEAEQIPGRMLILTTDQFTIKD